MKLGEKLLAGDDGKFLVQKTFDPNPSLAQVRTLKDADAMGTKDNKLVARVPAWLINEWCKEAGVAWSDVEARREVVTKKLLSGDAAAFRVWEGTY